MNSPEPDPSGIELERFRAYDWSARPLNVGRVIGHVALVVVGAENIDYSGGKLFAPNHWSPEKYIFADHLLIALAHRQAQGSLPQSEKKQMRFAARDTFFETTLKNRILRMYGIVPIGENRADITNIIELLRKGNDIAVYPEGTRGLNDGKEVVSIRDGVTVMASRGDVNIHPTAVVFGDQYTIFCKKHLVEFGRAIDTSGMRREQANALLLEGMNEVIVSACENFENIYGFTPPDPISRLQHAEMF